MLHRIALGRKTIWTHNKGSHQWVTHENVLGKKVQIVSGIWNKVDWESIGRAMPKFPVYQQCWASKYISGHFATGKNMQRWQFQTLAKCPQCPELIKDTRHILMCPNPLAHELWGKSLKQLDDWLKSKGTDISIREQLMLALKTWMIPDTANYRQGSLIDKQEQIGKQYIWDRWLSMEWR